MLEILFFIDDILNSVIYKGSPDRFLFREIICFEVIALSSKWILSATEIDTFETCRRKWAYTYLDGIKPPQSKAAELGLKVHEILRQYLTGNQINYHSKEGRVASAGLPYLPKRLPEKNVERQIFFTKHGAWFHGFIDFFEQVGCQTWLIGDHKTCSTLARVLSVEKLKKNRQANIYAQWAFTEKGAESVKLRWVYYRSTSTPKAICVETELSQKEAEDNFADITKVADEISTIAKERAASSTQPKNLSACFKYGRCSFYAHCKSDTGAATVNTKHREAKEFIMPSSSEEKPNSFHLYVDCVPTKNNTAYEKTFELSDILKPVLTKIQTEKELSHYRFAGFGQHVGLIANYLSEHLRNSAYDDRIAILSTIKTPEGCDTLQTLTALASQVVRGF